jgi:hypothetical protein
MEGNAFSSDRVLVPSSTMTRLVAGVLLALACGLSAEVTLASSHLGVGAGACAIIASQPAKQSCVVMPSRGAFLVTIPGTGAVLYGVGTPDRARKVITITRVPLVCPSLGGFGIRINTPRYAGLLPPLHWQNGTLYYRDHSTGHCIGVNSPALAAAPGTYQVVPASRVVTGVTTMPSSGGGASQDARPAVPVPLLLIALFLWLLGIPIVLATRH